MATDRKAEVTWHSDLLSGSGRIDSVTSGAFGGLDVSWAARSEEPNGLTSPEELIAAAHAGCFTMALSAQLGSAGLTPEKLETTATVTFDKLEAGWTVTGILLDVKGKVPKADQAAWDKATQAAKSGCPISRLLNTTVNMQAKLEK